MDPVGGTEALIVGRHHHEPAIDKTRHLLLVERLAAPGKGTNGSSDGAQTRANPVVLWPMASSGKPPGGVGSSGANTIPETATSLPSRAVEW